MIYFICRLRCTVKKIGVCPIREVWTLLSPQECEVRVAKRTCNCAMLHASLHMLISSPTNIHKMSLEGVLM